MYLCSLKNKKADLAQLAERKLPKLQVAGSNPVIRSKYFFKFLSGVFKNIVPLHPQNERRRKLSSVGSERLPYKQEVAGSNPAVSTEKRDV